MSISWKFHKISIHPLFRNVANKQGSRKCKSVSCIQRVGRITSKVFQTVRYVTNDLSGKFHENPFRHFPTMLLTDMKPRHVRGPWNSLVRRNRCSQIFYWVMPDISWTIQENPFTHFSIMMLSSVDPENRKIDPGSKVLNATSSKCSRLFLVSYPACPEMSWKSFHLFFRNVANSQGFPE